MNAADTIQLAYAGLSLQEKNIVRMHIRGNHVIGRKEAKEINDRLGDLTRGEEALVMIVADELTQFDHEAREFSASAEGLKYTMAEALVVKGLGQRILADFYLRFNRPQSPPGSLIPKRTRWNGCLPSLKSIHIGHAT